MAKMQTVPGAAKAAFQKMVKDLKDANVRVGWFDSSKYADDNQTPVAYVAAINEMGPNARPFMKPTADERDKEWADHMLIVSKRVVKGAMTVEQALEAVGLKVATDIQYKITQIQDPPLSLITLFARKYRRDGQKVTGKTIGEIAAHIDEVGDSAARAEVDGISTKPLNESGYMLATVSYSVNGETPKAAT